MVRKKRKFCIILSMCFYCIGSGLGKEQLEMMTLLGDQKTVESKCLFDSEEQLTEFLEAMGITVSSLLKTECCEKKGGYVMKELICPKPLGNTFLLQYHWYATYGNGLATILQLGMVTTLFLMDENTPELNFDPGNVSLRHIGDPNRILHLQRLMNQAREKEKCLREKGHLSKKEEKRRQKILEGRYNYQCNRFKVWALLGNYM